MKLHRLQFYLSPNERQEKRIPPFPFDGISSISIAGSSLFSYQLHSIDTDTYYSDKPILCGVKKEFLPFSSYEGRVFSFDFENKSNEENRINLDVRFERHQPSAKYYSLREYTLDGLYLRSLIDIEAGEEVEISLTNFRGGHYEVHQIYSSQYKGLSCKIKYHNQPIERFDLENTYRFKRPWVFRWPDSATLILKNEGNSKLEIKPTEIYFAGYLLKPTDVLKTVAPINSRDSFLIEGIRLR
jgi:hypothetical protein